MGRDLRFRSPNNEDQTWDGKNEKNSWPFPSFEPVFRRYLPKYSVFRDNNIRRITTFVSVLVASAVVGLRWLSLS